ncbi:hypothetical protein Tco_1513464, partial [Tanacetum coccineum]
KQFEEYIKIKSRLEVHGINTDVECNPTNVEFPKWLASKFNNHKTMDWYTKNTLWLYWKRGDDEEVLTGVEFYDLEEERLKDGDLKDEALKEKSTLEKSWGHENRKENNFCSWLKESFEDEESSEDSWSNYLPNAEGINNGNDAIQANQEWFDDHELMKDDDDDIGDLDNNLISKGFKERMSKLIGIPYEKPSTFKSENFEVIKYSFGPVEEYVAIKEYEYDIWVQTEENVSHIYQESFCKKDEGWSLKRTK